MKKKYNFGDRVIVHSEKEWHQTTRKGIIVNSGMRNRDPMDYGTLYYKVKPIYTEEYDETGTLVSLPSYPLVCEDNMKLDNEYYRNLKINQIIDGI